MVIAQNAQNMRWIALALLGVLLQFYMTQKEWSIGSDFLEVQQRIVKKLFTERKNEKLVQQAQEKKQSLGVDVQPDEVRLRAKDGVGQPEEECVNTAFGPHSTLTTRGVEIMVDSSFRGSYADPAKFGREQFSWSYHVTFKNRGKDTVQMLTRHWIFTDDNGKVEEVKGPGARGNTPILHPGEKWEYDSGTSFETPRGSMTGSFQMEVLQWGDGSDSSIGNSFSANVARLGLITPNDAGKIHVPCGRAAAPHLVPTTSVFAASRVIVGVNSEHLERASDPVAGEWEFQYDVQINNARAHPVKVLAHRWEVAVPVPFDSSGSGSSSGASASASVRVLEEGPGLGGFRDTPETVINPGEATRYMGSLRLRHKRAVAWGAYTVAIGPDYDEVEVKIGRMALSVDGEPVDPKEFGLA